MGVSKEELIEKVKEVDTTISLSVNNWMELSDFDVKDKTQTAEQN